MKMPITFLKVKKIGLLFFISLIIAACAQPAFKARSLESPELLHCNDITGHRHGATPFVMGGTCTCTPTESNFALHKDQGTINETMTYASYMELYRSRSIVTDLDHKGCNNLCDHGPHVVFGGGCMATPTPGTLNYEKVVSGQRGLTLIKPIVP